MGIIHRITTFMFGQYKVPREGAEGLRSNDSRRGMVRLLKSYISSLDHSGFSGLILMLSQ